MDYSRFPEAGEQILGEITNIFIIRGHHFQPLKMGNGVGKVVMRLCYQAVEILLYNSTPCSIFLGFVVLS